jgi:hypothetical protein
MKKTLCVLPFVFATSAMVTAQAEPTDLGGGFSLSGNAESLAISGFAVIPKRTSVQPFKWVSI